MIEAITYCTESNNLQYFTLLVQIYSLACICERKIIDRPYPLLLAAIAA